MPSGGTSDDDDEPSKRTALSVADSSITESPSGNRRGLLRGVAAATAGLIGFAGSSAAAGDAPTREHLIAAAREYDSERAVRGAIRKHSMDLIQALANDSYIDYASPSALPLEMHSTIESFIDSDRGVGVFGIRRDTGAVTKIRIKTRVPDGRVLELQIVPETGERRTRLVDKATGDSTALTLDSTSEQTATTEEVCCYEWRSEEHCRITCNPYGQCSCVRYRLCKYQTENGCLCDILGYDCTGCTRDSDC